VNAVTYIKQLTGSLLSRRRRVIQRTYTLSSSYLKRQVRIDVYRPAVPPWRLLRLVIFNDGQDLPRMDFQQRLRTLYKKDKLPPTLIVGVYAHDRMEEYGTAGKADYLGRGKRAADYTAFILEELVPWLEERNNVFFGPDRRAIAGFSLGGLSAFDIAWRHPRQFRTAGVFSGSLWYRSRDFDPKRPDANRIVHDYVSRSKRKVTNRFWFMAGTADEQEDRNQNGIIDSIDDTIQLMALLQQKGLRPEEDMTYVEVAGGRHEPETWGEVIGDFLKWAIR
jgi:enterochelin esterase-like enzyme